MRNRKQGCQQILLDCTGQLSVAEQALAAGLDFTQVSITPGSFDSVKVGGNRNALPSDLKDPVKSLYLSGWRVSEMRNLGWKEVDRAANLVRLDPSKTKTKEPRILSLAGEMGEIIKRAVARGGLDSRFVFLACGWPALRENATTA